jgi:exopolysaccharide biosynthesis polyprenyl glycosylphosphotransferase
LFFSGSTAAAQAELNPIARRRTGSADLSAVPHDINAFAPKSKEALRLRLYAGLVLTDAFCIFGGFVAANAFRFDDPFAARGLGYSAAFLPPFLALALASGAYSLEALERPMVGAWKSLRALMITVLALLIALFLSKSSTAVSRVTVALGITLAAIALVAARRGYGRCAGELTHWSFINELLLIDGVPGVRTGRHYTFFADEHGISSRANDPRTLEALGKLLEGFDRVLVAAPEENRLAWREMLRGAGIDIELLAPELDQFGAIRVRRSDLGPALLVAPGPLRIQERIVKRAFDLVVATWLLLLLMPLMLSIALAIKLTSTGPALFRQRRFGRANRQFEMLKFRTMYFHRCDADGACSARFDDDRITPLGRLLRRTSMDELPQLINVLKGEMSLVGPRPHALASSAENSLFWNIDGRYWHRGAVKPGITGLAQVRGYRGATRTTNDVTNRVNSDLEYLLQWSIWRDIRILIRTASVLAHHNAF